MNNSFSNIESLSSYRSRSYVFTLNNPNEEDMQLMDVLMEKASCRKTDLSFLCYGKEGEERTPHLQGFIYFLNKKSLKQCKELIPRAHFEVKKGSFKQAIDYCMKEGNYFESGDRPCDGKVKLY